MSGSSFTTTTESVHWSPHFDEVRWVIQIRRTLDDVLEEDDDIQVTVFNVPKPLLQAKPEAFVPQIIALGPYHHWRPELYDMEKYKLSAAKRIQRQLSGVNFEGLVDGISKLEIRIRGNYHRYLDLKCETLAWMMAMDTCFLLEFLQVYAKPENGRVLKRVSTRMSHLVDRSGKKSGHNTILRDVMMLENQIPMFLLGKVLDLLCHPTSSSSRSHEDLVVMLTGFMQEVCPLVLEDNFPAIDVSQKSHLLDLLYRILVPMDTREDLGCSNDIELEKRPDVAYDTGTGRERNGLPGETDHLKELGKKVWKIVVASQFAAARLLKRIVFSRPVRVLFKLPWNLLTSIPGFSVLQRIPGAFTFSSQPKSQSSNFDQASPSDDNKQPLVEEILIPSVVELVESGVRFSSTGKGLTSIAFDAKNAVFHLPTMCLDVNSEVILRNLVAYEASVAPGPLVFTRYTELMNGIIDTEEDVRLLRKFNIVQNHLKRDKKVAELWNGMSRSVRLTRVHFIDKVIEDVNRYHNSRWKVKAKKSIKKFLLSSWPVLTFLAAVLLLLLTSLQAFCSVYNCSRWFEIPTVTDDQS